MPIGPPDHALAFLDDELNRLDVHALLRVSRLVSEGELVLCSNDYLGLGKLPLDLSPSGAGASPLVVGFQVPHARAEASLAEWLETEASLLFSSGYAANVGTIGALVGPGDVIISDALNHASIIDGCRLSGATISVVSHLNVNAVVEGLAASRGARRRLVVTESYFSMDADGPDLSALRSVCSAEGAILMVDEAHSLGIEGPAGRGRCAMAGIVPDVLVGTLGKAFGLQGAFIAGSAALRLYLWNRARSLVFSTGLSPALAQAVPERLAWLRAADRPRALIAGKAGWIRRELTSQGWTVPGAGHVVPIIVGSAERTTEISQALLRSGLVLQGIRPPTVPRGMSRLRLTVTSDTPSAALEQVARSLSELRNG